MKIALTGAGGALGREFMSLYPDTVPVRVRYGEYAQLRAVLPTVDILIHAGALVPSEHTTNELFIHNFLIPHDIHQDVGDLPVVFISSMSILSADGSKKSEENMTKYTKSKLHMEREAKHYKNHTIVRFSTLFYRNPTKDGLSKLIYTAKTEGRVSVRDCVRDFLPLAAACRILREICSSPRHGVLNIGTGQQTNMLDVARYLQERYGVEVEVREGTGDDICSSFPSPESLEVDLYKEIDDYYQSIGE